MATGIFAFGHGGGVLGPGYPGNSNFAIIPDLPAEYLRGTDILDASADVVDLLSRPYWLLDCGTETARYLAGLNPWGKILTPMCRGVILTHCHDDHSGGLKILAYRRRWGDGITEPLPLIYPEALREYVLQQTVELGGVWYFEHRRDTPLGSPFFIRRSLAVDHNLRDAKGEPLAAFAYELQITSAPYRGLVARGAYTLVAFSGDTAFPEYTRLMQSNYIIHDVQGYDDGKSGAQVHCPYAWLRGAVPECRRRQVLLSHLGDFVPPQEDGFRVFKGGMLFVIS
jgi:ribonuclease BN (tRNA processing enzyme)